MATFTKTNAGTWKAEIRRKGWPKVYKNFRTKRDAEDWARAKEDEMVRGSFITRENSENTAVRSAARCNYPASGLEDKPRAPPSASCLSLTRVSAAAWQESSS